MMIRTEEVVFESTGDRREWYSVRYLSGDDWVEVTREFDQDRAVMSARFLALSERRCVRVVHIVETEEGPDAA